MPTYAFSLLFDRLCYVLYCVYTVQCTACISPPQAAIWGYFLYNFPFLLLVAFACFPSSLARCIPIGRRLKSRLWGYFWNSLLCKSLLFRQKASFLKACFLKVSFERFALFSLLQLTLLFLTLASYSRYLLLLPFLAFYSCSLLVIFTPASYSYSFLVLLTPVPYSCSLF